MLMALASRTDVADLAAEYAATGSVSVPGLLTPSAAAGLREAVEGEGAWVEIFRAGETVYEMPHATFLGLPNDQKDDLRRLVEQSAKGGLQYRYRTVRVCEEPQVRAESGRPIDRFTDLLNSPEALALLRAITGNAEISLVDAQATDYRAGDFLTTHDDAIEGKHRRAAYVFGLTTGWQADWGGLLLFEKGDRVTGYIPDYNALRLFAVPARHHVSMVSPWVEARRLSITGWLRAASPEGV